MTDDKFKFERKEGIKYLRCEHLIKGIMDDESDVQWVGENTRMILCPICLNVKLGNFLKIVSRYEDHNAEPTDEEKEPVKDTWMSMLRRMFIRDAKISKKDEMGYLIERFYEVVQIFDYTMHNVIDMMDINLQVFDVINKAAEKKEKATND